MSNSETPPAFATGTTAYAVMRWIFISCVGSLLFIAIFLVPTLGMSTNTSIRRPLMIVCAAPAMLFGLSNIPAGIALGHAIRRERQAGYTTLYGNNKTQHLWQLNPKTGEVIRRPNESTNSL